MRGHRWNSGGRIERHEALDPALLDQGRDGAFYQCLEIGRRLMRLQRCLVDITLVKEIAARLVRIAVELIGDAAGLLSGLAGERFEDRLELALALRPAAIMNDGDGAHAG